MSFVSILFGESYLIFEDDTETQTFLGSMTKLAIIASELQTDLGPSRRNIQTKISKIIQKLYPKLSFEQTCLLAGSLGLDYIDNDLAIDLQNFVFPVLKEASVEELELFILGFYHSYLIDPDLYRVLKPQILAAAEDFELDSLLKLVRAIYVLDFESESDIHNLAESRVLSMIRDDSQSLGINDFYQIFMTFHMTRKASRELYKLSEYVFMMRLPEFYKDLEYLEKIDYIFTTSGLVEPDVIRKIEDYLPEN